MGRRIQFSLRVLLGAVGLCCILLGGWHLLNTYGTHVDAVNVRIGAPVQIKGRYFSPFGPEECGLVVGYARTDETGSISKHLNARRSWLCFYSVEYELDPLDRRCQIIVFLNRHERPNTWTLKEKIVDVN